MSTLRALEAEKLVPWCLLLCLGLTGTEVVGLQHTSLHPALTFHSFHPGGAASKSTVDSGFNN